MYYIKSRGQNIGLTEIHREVVTSTYTALYRHGGHSTSLQVGTAGYWCPFVSGLSLGGSQSVWVRLLVDTVIQYHHQNMNSC